MVPWHRTCDSTGPHHCKQWCQELRWLLMILWHCNQFWWKVLSFQMILSYAIGECHLSHLNQLNTLKLSLHLSLSEKTDYDPHHHGFLIDGDLCDGDSFSYCLWLLLQCHLLNGENVIYINELMWSFCLMVNINWLQHWLQNIPPPKFSA